MRLRRCLVDCPAELLKYAILLLIRLYKYVISPLVGPACRFYPSCSTYAYQAISKYGVIRGMMLSIRRILRCNPWHPGGIDPVP